MKPASTHVYPTTRVRRIPHSCIACAGREVVKAREFENYGNFWLRCFVACFKKPVSEVTLLCQATKRLICKAKVEPRNNVVFITVISVELEAKRCATRR